MSRRRPIPFVAQMEASDCGAACLAMVLAYHGKRVGLDDLREETGTDRDGVDALAVARAARRHGLDAHGVAADIHELRHLPPASILHWGFHHFVVFEGLDRRGVRIIDPALGPQVISMEAFRRSYTGVAIVAEPDDGFERSDRPAKGTWRYLRPLLGQSRMLARVLVSSALIRVAALALPLLTGLLVDEVAPNGDRHLLLVVALGMLMAVGYHFITELARGHLLLQLRTQLDVRLTTAFVDHLVRLPYSFFLRRSAGDLMMRLQSNAVVREILTTGALSAVLDGGLAGLYLVLLLFLSPPLALLVAGLGFLQVSVLLVSWRRNQRLMAESLQVEARAQGYAYELLSGIETLKASGTEARASERWQALFADEVNVALARGRLDALVDALTGALHLGSPLAVLVFGGLEVVDGDLTLGTMLAAAALAAGFLDPLSTLVETGLELQLMGSYMERINDVLDTPAEQQGQDLPPAPPLTGRVSAAGACFSYGPLSPPAVQNVSLEIEPGQVVGIVGRSGSGKSTLAHLLLGLYQPTAGQIRFDGYDLADVDITSFRRQVGIVTQRPYLFGGTIRDNIAYVDPDMAWDDVVAAARLACIDEEIEEMAMGYDTMLLDGGSSLSGGQQQRIALARALAHRPAIVLLDEATSDLDTITERLVLDQLSRLGRTTIVIAHRLTSVVGADVILVMDKGRVVERGAHHELLAADGLYRRLAAAQIDLGG